MYSIGGFLGGPICALMPRRYVLLTTFILMTYAIVLIGPSQLLDLPDTLPIMLIGLAILGLAIGVLMVPTIPELIEPV
jgi:predicted MFS family arabinose efflux permease